MYSTTVAVFGYGILGKSIVRDLVAQGARVILLSRDASKLKDVPSAVKTASIDYTNESQVALVLKEHAVDLVIISLANGSETTNGSEILTVVQVCIARAAKEAGVKLFLPNEFGPETEGYGPGSVFGDQSEAFAKIKEVGIATTKIIPGSFTDFTLWLTSTESKPGKFVVAGKGEAKLGLTALSDVTGYVAHILTNIPLSELYNKTLLIEGQAATFKEIAQALGKDITYVLPEEIEHPFVRFLQEVAEKGGFRSGYSLANPDASEEVVSKRSSSGNALWKGHQWKQIRDVLAV